MNNRPVLLPSIAVACSGALWGVYWIPIRQLYDLGVPASWASFISFGIVATVFIGVFAWQKFASGRLPWSVFFTGFLSGMSVIFYSIALTLTEVVTTVLLFYMTPVWSTILGKIILKEKVTVSRIAAVIVGIAGLFVILGVANGLPEISNLGDFLALASGIIWAYATVRISADQQAAVWEQVGAFYIGGAIVCIVFIFLPIHGLEKAPSLVTLSQSIFWLTIFVFAFLPSVFLVFWGAKILSPARVGILLMSEIIFGVTTAALLSGEPFGWQQGIGVTLIMGAAIIDVSDRLFESLTSERSSITKRK